MPVIDNRGKPLDDNHPFKGTRIVFGTKRPEPSSPPSKAEATDSRGYRPEELWTAEELGPDEQQFVGTAKPTAFDLEVGERYRQAMLALRKRDTANPATEAPPSSESTTPKSPEQP